MDFNTEAKDSTFLRFFVFFSRIPGGMRFPRELAVQQHQNRNEIQLVIPEALADGSDAQDGKQTLTKSE